MSSAKGSASNLVQAAKTLSLEWQETRAHWHDVKSQEFERTYLEELPANVTRAALIIEELDNVLRKIRSDCE